MFVLLLIQSHLLQQATEFRDANIHEVTGDYQKFIKLDLGRLEIPAAGRTVVTLKAVQSGWQPVNVRAIVLKPVKE